jgi:hypothetical protein
MIKDKTTIKAEYKPGGKNRQVILDKAVLRDQYEILPRSKLP